MRCSDCSNVVEPLVAIDIDGTLGDYHTHFANFAAAWLNKWPDGMYDYVGHIPHGDWFTACFNVDRTTFRAIKLAYRQGGQKRVMPIYHGAANFVKTAYRMRCEVWITTTRPWERFDRIDPDSRHWLEKHEIPSHALLFNEDKVEELYHRVDPRRVVMILDDQDDVLERAEQYFPGAAVQKMGKHNKASSWSGTRLEGFGNIRSMLYQRVQNWRHHYEGS